MINYLIYIGCDISKAVIDVSYHCGGQAIYLAQFKNSEKGFTAFRKALIKRIDNPSNEWFVCFENTGVYSKPLLNWLSMNNIACKEESALKIFR